MHEIKTEITLFFFRLHHNTRSKINHALKGESKSASTKEILGDDIDLYKERMEFQTTPEMNWSNIEIDQVKPISLFDLSRDEKILEAFIWVNTQPILKEVHLNRVKKLFC